MGDLKNRSRIIGVRLVMVLGGLLFFAGLANSAENQLDRGATLLHSFKYDLMQALQSGLKRGVLEAVASCRLRAPEISEARSGHGAPMGRTSHRLRNPTNVAPTWVWPILENYLSDPSDRSPRTTKISQHRTGYVEPIITVPLCLSCHGESLAAGVAMKIKELYPADQAVGFRTGDLRGVFWIEFPALD